jgi:hypothetical protein
LRNSLCDWKIPVYIRVSVDCMETALSKPGNASKAVVAPTMRATLLLSRAEIVALAFFTYLAALSWIRHLPLPHRLVLICLPLLFWSLWKWERAATRPWTRVLREYMTLGLILMGYWSLQWFASTSKLGNLQDRWVAWDQLLLRGYGMRAAIESLGGFIPAILETVYLSLYAIPPVFLTILFLTGARKSTHQFLYILMLGTLTVYACLLFIPVESPRIVYPGMDSPNYSSGPRMLNTWLLDHMDISTSVFPSGHVGVAFSTAFGLFSAVRRRRAVWMSGFALAILVFAATIYGRYHYAADGMASIALTSVVCLAGERWSTSPPK